MSTLDGDVDATATESADGAHAGLSNPPASEVDATPPASVEVEATISSAFWGPVRIQVDDGPVHEIPAAERDAEEPRRIALGALAEGPHVAKLLDAAGHARGEEPILETEFRVRAGEDEPMTIAIVPPDRADGMIRIPGGTFMMGTETIRDAHPVHEVTLSPYWIDRTEITVSKYRACVEADRCRAPETGRQIARQGYVLNSRNWSRPDRAQHPVNGVSWDDAVVYCEWREARLPTEAEWEFAARGSDGRIYPWGNQVPSDDLATFRIPTQDGSAEVGSRSAGRSPFDLEDMAGNVWEWVSDWYGPYPSEGARNPSGASTGDERVVRGGAWNSSVRSIRATNRSSFRASTREQVVGFRCARDGL